MEEEFYKTSNAPHDNEDKLTKLAERAFEMGDFKLFIKLFDKVPICFYNLGVNAFHDNLLNLLVALILMNLEHGCHIFRKLNFESLWEMKTYDLYFVFINFLFKPI